MLHTSAADIAAACSGRCGDAAHAHSHNKVTQEEAPTTACFGRGCAGILQERINRLGASLCDPARLHPWVALRACSNLLDLGWSAQEHEAIAAAAFACRACSRQRLAAGQVGFKAGLERRDVVPERPERRVLRALVASV